MSNKTHFDNLFRFIKKNTFIPNFLSGIKPDDSKAGELLAALKKGDANSKIFDDHDCYLYLLYLLKTDQFPFWPGITVYGYLTALMQFTTKQPIRNEDTDIKLKRKVEVYELSRDQVLTPEGEKYLKSVQNNVAKIRYPFSSEKLKEFILNLPPVEQWLIKIPYTKTNIYETAHDVERLFTILSPNIPACVGENINDREHCLIPSSSLFHYVLQHISSDPIEIMPIFGSIGVEQIKKLHEQGIHPLSIYALHVLSNPKNADEYRCGPFLMKLHDWGHGIWISILSKAERVFIFNIFIPQMRSFINIAKTFQDKPLVMLFERSIDKASDFDLTNIKFFCGNNKLILYLTKALNIDFMTYYPYFRREATRFSFALEDKLYFLLLKLHYELPAGEQKDFWWNLAESVKTNVFKKCPLVVNVIQQLARFAAGGLDAILIFSHIELTRNDCEAWLKIIDAKKTSEEVWKTIFNENKDEQFLELIANGRLLFFHPYLPLSSEMRNSFKEYLEKTIIELNQTQNVAASPAKAFLR